MDSIDLGHNLLPSEVPTINVDFPKSAATDKFILFENYMRETAHFQTGIQPVNIFLVLIFDKHQPSVYEFHTLTPTLYLQTVLYFC